MTLSPEEQAAIDLLELINGNQYDAATNPRGMGDPGYLFNFEPAISAIALVGSATARETAAAAASASTASTAATTATSAKDAAIVARNAAEAAAASATFPFGVTTGTSTAYVLDFTPDQVTAAGSAFRVQFHTANGATPTLSVDGGTAAEIVNQAGQSLSVGDIATNRIYIVIFDAALSKWAISEFVANEVLRSDETATLEVGFDTELHDLGTISSGTLTLNPALGNKQEVVNNGDFTLVAPAVTTNMSLTITNGSSAGTVTFSGFTKTDLGDALNTTENDVFQCYIDVSGSIKLFNAIHAVIN